MKKIAADNNYRMMKRAITGIPNVVYNAMSEQHCIESKEFERLHSIIDKCIRDMQKSMRMLRSADDVEGADTKAMYMLRETWISLEGVSGDFRTLKDG